MTNQLSPEQITLAIRYCSARVEEQTSDNIDDPECIATEERPNHLGVDYQRWRKQLGRHLRPHLYLVNGEWIFDQHGRDVVYRIMATGVSRQQIAQWVYKYNGDYVHRSFILRKVFK